MKRMFRSFSFIFVVLGVLVLLLTVATGEINVLKYANYPLYMILDHVDFILDAKHLLRWAMLVIFSYFVFGLILDYVRMFLQMRQNSIDCQKRQF